MMKTNLQLPIPSHDQSQIKYEKLQANYIALVMENAYLRHQNQDLLQLLDTLNNDNSLFSSFQQQFLDS